MNTITLTPETTKENGEQTAKTEMHSWRDLKGIFKTDKSDKELLDEYLSEKYGV